jgi:hypothetical protein
LGGWVQVDAADEHGCAVAATGKLQCWGGGRLLSTGAHLVQNNTASYLAVATGTDFTCAIAQGYLDQSGTAQDLYALHCWGAGALSNGWAEVAEAAAAGAGVAAVDLGKTYGCVIMRADGTLKCWGDTSTPMIPPAGSYKDVNVAEKFGACAIRVDDVLVCWGALWTRPDGSGGKLYSFEYTSGTYGTFDAVTVADTWMCARRTADRSLYCMGGLVPRLFRTTASIPASAVREFGSDADTLCIVSADGKLTCYGGGALGNRLALSVRKASQQQSTDGSGLQINSS